MSTLAVILADLHFSAPASERPETLPALPALGRLLGRARREALPGGWRPWLARQLCAAQPDAGRSPGQTWAGIAASAPAALAAAARPGAPDGRHYWFATPVHYFAGIQSVHLYPDGLLSLNAAAQAALAASFAAVFTDGGLELIATGRRDLLLAGDASAAGSEGVISTDPSRWLGADPSPGLPAGPGSGRLRRLETEIELWLHEHPVNRERTARGELPVTALWLWGGGVVGQALAAWAAQHPRPAERDAVVLHAQDVFSEALARLSGARWQGVTGADERQAVPGIGQCGAQLDIAVLPSADPAKILPWVETAWLAPGLAQLAQGALSELLLLAGAHLYRATRPRLWRVWRPDAAWWQALATATAQEESQI